MSRKKRLAVFASGTGSNFEAIVTACEQGKIPAETVALVCDKPSARVVERASRHGVKSFTFDPKSFASKVEMETVIADFPVLHSLFYGTSSGKSGEQRRVFINNLPS